MISSLELEIRRDMAGTGFVLSHRNAGRLEPLVFCESFERLVETLRALLEDEDAPPPVSAPDPVVLEARVVIAEERLEHLAARLEHLLAKNR